MSHKTGKRPSRENSTSYPLINDKVLTTGFSAEWSLIYFKDAQKTKPFRTFELPIP